MRGFKVTNKRKQTKRFIGDRAEQRAVRYLQLRGWRICARNWVAAGGELDIVASRWKTLLIVEVRYRSAADPLESIHHDKIQRVMRTAQSLVYRHKLQRYRLRLDVIGIDANNTINHQKDIVRNNLIGK